MEFLQTMGIIVLLLFLHMLYLNITQSKVPTSDDLSKQVQTFQQSTKTSSKASTTQIQWETPTTIETIDYIKYIDSMQWQTNPARIATLQADEYLCRMCKSPHNIHVHHINYDNIGNEEQFQLATLCEECHTYTHLMAGKGSGYYPPLKKQI